jgi:hypothetical protein
MEQATFEREPVSRSIIPGKQVRLTGESARVIQPRPAGDCEPLIELVREGNQVRAIDIRCSCGKRIYLECEY